MPETAYDETWSNGQLISRIERVVSDAEIERRESSQQLRQALTTLRQWGNDNLSPAEITALTAVQRIQRQAVQEQRVAQLSRLVLRLIWRAGEDDGS